MKTINYEELQKERAELSSENKSIDRSIDVLKKKKKANDERIKSIDELTHNQYEIDFEQPKCQTIN